MKKLSKLQKFSWFILHKKMCFFSFSNFGANQWQSMWLNINVKKIMLLLETFLGDLFHKNNISIFALVKPNISIR